MAPCETAEAVFAQVSSHNKPATSGESRDYEHFVDEGRATKAERVDSEGLRGARERSTQLHPGAQARHPRGLVCPSAWREVLSRRPQGCHGGRPG